MTNGKTTKRALFSSIVALMLCFSMLLGTTFAWFTDSTVSGNNIIKTGNLDMKLSYKPYGASNTTWTEVKDDSVIFGKDALYEPGYTEAVWLKVENLGSLAFRYDLAINVASEKPGTNKAGKEFKLSDYLDVKYMTTTSTNMESNFYTTRESLDSFNFGGVANSGVTSLKDDIAVIKNGVAYSKNDTENGAYSSAYVLVVISMPETVDNEANHNGTNIPEINFTLTAVATQLAYEKDSFGSDYDANSEYPKVKKPIKIPNDATKVVNLEELKAALAIGGNINIVADISVTGNLPVSNDVAIYSDGKTMTFTNNSNVTVSDDTTLELYGVKMDGEGTFSWSSEGTIQYDADARRTVPLLKAGAGTTLKLGQDTVIENVVAKGSAVVSVAGTDEKRSTVIIEGATIKNCAGESGTIINVDKASDVIIGEDTVITGNASYNNNNHGIIRVYNAWDAQNPSTVTMNGGQINGNYFSGNGMIGLYYGKFIMNGGEINNNSWFEDNQKNNGWYPIVYAHSNSQFIMNGGEIIGNSVKYGVINSLNSSVEGALTINGGTIENNIATNTGNDALAAVYNKDLNPLVISDDANVSGTVYIYTNDKESKYEALDQYFAG